MDGVHTFASLQRTKTVYFFLFGCFILMADSEDKMRAIIFRFPLLEVKICSIPYVHAKMQRISDFELLKEEKEKSSKFK